MVAGAGLSVLPFFSRKFRGSVGIRVLVFCFVVLLAFSQKQRKDRAERVRPRVPKVSKKSSDLTLGLFWFFRDSGGPEEAPGDSFQALFGLFRGSRPKGTPSLKLVVDFSVWSFWWIFCGVVVGFFRPFSLEKQAGKIHRNIHPKIHGFQRGMSCFFLGTDRISSRRKPH